MGAHRPDNFCFRMTGFGRTDGRQEMNFHCFSSFDDLMTFLLLPATIWLNIDDIVLSQLEAHPPSISVDLFCDLSALAGFPLLRFVPWVLGWGGGCVFSLRVSFCILLAHIYIYICTF